MRKKRWKIVWTLLHAYVVGRFHLTAPRLRPDGPCLIVANHTCNWDPLLLSMSFPDTPIRFVASEHLFRSGFFSAVLEWIAAPIPRKKGASGADTVKSVLRALKEGSTVCIFAEGDATWDGRTHPVFPATGKLARMAGVPLMTYRLEGGYLSLPRWAGTIRRGRVRGVQAGFYTPEQLRTMSGKEITGLIDRDLYEDAFARQRREHVLFHGRNRAEGMERGFFICPKCGKLGSIRGAGDRVVCSCGLDLHYTLEGLFEPPEPVADLSEWEDRQEKAFRRLLSGASGPLFSDEGMILREIGREHSQKVLARGTLVQLPDALEIAGHSFPLSDVGSMAMVKAGILLFSVGDRYYEIRGTGCCLRKYLMAWQLAAK